MASELGTNVTMCCPACEQPIRLPVQPSRRLRLIGARSLDFTIDARPMREHIESHKIISGLGGTNE